VTFPGYGTAPGLIVSAQPLQFGTIDTGAGGKALSVTFSNSSLRPEAFTGFRPPVAGYTVSGMPVPGSILAPRQAVTASVLSNPTRAGSHPSSLQISTDQGSITLPVGGEALTGYARPVSPTTLDAGSVPVGQSRTITFAVGNAGTVPLTISRAIAPLGAFSADEPMPQGIRHDPGTFVHQSVTFEPPQAGPASARYLFNSNDGQGYVAVTLTGTGT
jgi:hypothetical protein